MQTRREIIKKMAAALVLPALSISTANAITHKPNAALGCGEEFPWC